MKKYTHSKESTKPLLKKHQRALDIRKIDNHTTVERQFGHFHPKFGSALGTGYDGTTGVVQKTNRAGSVGSGPKSAEVTYEWSFSFVGGASLRLSYISKVGGVITYTPITDKGNHTFDVASTNAGAPASVAFWIDEATDIPVSDNYRVYCGLVPFYSTDGGSTGINFVTLDTDPNTNELITADVTSSLDNAKIAWMDSLFAGDSSITIF